MHQLTAGEQRFDGLSSGILDVTDGFVCGRLFSEYRGRGGGDDQQGGQSQALIEPHSVFRTSQHEKSLSRVRLNGLIEAKGGELR